MSNYFTSDLHIGHRAICKYRPHFKTPEEHDLYWIEKIEALGKRDILFILGDFLFPGPKFDEYHERLQKVKCRIKLVMGNHDSLELYQNVNPVIRSNKPVPSRIEIQLPLFSYKNFWLSHCPIHPQEMRNRKLNIHGHLHASVLDDTRYFDVCPEKHNYEFVDFESIKKYAEK